MPAWEAGVQSGTRANQPTPTSDMAGVLYFVEDEGVLERWSATAWVQVSGGNTADEAWHEIGAAGEPAFENGASNYGATYATGAFRKLSSGLVVMKGLVNVGSGAVVFTLPSGYRPSATLLIMCIRSGNLVNRIDILSDGTFSSSVTGAWIGIGDISFYPDGN